MLSWLLVICMVFTALFPMSAVRAAEPTGEAEATVIDATAYGADPSGAKDSAKAIQKAIEAAKQVDGPVIINFPKGEYQIYPDKAYERELYISNTVGQDQNYKMKKIGFLLEDMEDVTVEGNGSLFMFHGKMTTYTTINCKNVKFQNFATDFYVPTVVDITTESVDGNTAVIYVPECYNYEIHGTSVTWKSDASPYTGQTYWSFNNGANYSQRYNLKNGVTWRAGNPIFSNVTSIEDLGSHRLKFTYSSRDGGLEPGICVQMRPTVRDHAGMFFWKSSNVTLENMDVHYLHGFGMVGQSSENITLHDVDFQTPEGSGRTTAGYADFIQMSGCKGQILIDGCTFSNPHDDPINVHGTFNEVVERISDNLFRVRYRHDQTAGFPNFFVGDEVEFISKSDMSAVENSVAKVTEVLGPTGDSGASESGTGSLTDMIVTLDRDMPEDITPWAYMIENITYTPALTVQNCLFKEVPTRGILVTTRKPVVIRKNIFDAMTMASIYIESNSTDWYESGGVKDLTIEDNIFYRPSNPAILISPTETANKDKPVHRNIKIRSNTFYINNGQVLSAKSTSGISFTGNRIYRFEPNVTVTMTAEKTSLTPGEAVNLSGNATGKEQGSGLYYFNGCTGITIGDNLYDGGLNLRADLSASDAKLTVPMDDAKETVYTIQYQADPADAGSLKAESNETATSNGFIQVAEGKSVTLTAAPDEVRAFQGWYDENGTKVTEETVLTVSDVRAHAVYTAKYLERHEAAVKAAEEAKEAAETARTAAEEAQAKAEAAKEAAETAAEAAKDAKLDAETAQSLAEAARDQAKSACEEAQTAAQKAAEKARDNAEALLKEAQDKLDAKLAQAKETLEKARVLREQLDEMLKSRTFAEQKVAITKAAGAKKAVKIGWKKVEGAEGYAIQYGTKANLKGAKTVLVKKGTAVSRTIKKLKAGKTYYVRVKAYKTVNGKKLYTLTSAKKKVRVK